MGRAGAGVAGAAGITGGAGGAGGAGGGGIAGGAATGAGVNTGAIGTLIRAAEAGAGDGAKAVPLMAPAPSAWTAKTLPHTAQRARTPDAGTLAGSTR
jgi:hypothetical protein